MDDHLQRLEEQLENLLPRGLGETARERLEGQIDLLAEEVAADRDGGGSGRWAIGIAAAAVLMAGFALVAVRNGPGLGAAAGVGIAPPHPVPTPFETVEVVEHVEERFDGGYIVGRGDQGPHRYWGYGVTEMEKLVDAETGWTVRISTQREEAVLTKLTTF